MISLLFRATLTLNLAWYKALIAGMKKRAWYQMFARKCQILRNFRVNRNVHAKTKYVTHLRLLSKVQDTSLRTVACWRPETNDNDAGLWYWNYPSVNSNRLLASKSSSANSQYSSFLMVREGKCVKFYTKSV